MSEKLLKTLETLKKEVWSQNQVSTNFNAENQTTSSWNWPVITQIEVQKTFDKDKE